MRGSIFLTIPLDSKWVFDSAGRFVSLEELENAAFEKNSVVMIVSRLEHSEEVDVLLLLLPV